MAAWTAPEGTGAPFALAFLNFEFLMLNLGLDDKLFYHQFQCLSGLYAKPNLRFKKDPKLGK